MPAVIVRQRLGSRSGKMSYRLNRWYWRNRANIAVTTAFAAACVIGLAASVGAHALGLQHGKQQLEQARYAAR